MFCRTGARRSPPRIAGCRTKRAPMKKKSRWNFQRCKAYISCCVPFLVHDLFGRRASALEIDGLTAPARRSSRLSRAAGKLRMRPADTIIFINYCIVITSSVNDVISPVLSVVTVPPITVTIDTSKPCNGEMYEGYGTMIQSLSLTYP